MAPGEASEADRPEPEPPPPALRLWFVTLPRIAIGAALLAGIAVNFINVVTRHFFGFALFWAEEILVFGTLWSVAIAVIAITFNGEHLSMDLVSASLPRRWRAIVNAFTVALFVAVGTFVAVQSYMVVTSFARTGMVSVTVGLPLTIPHSALLVGLTLAVLAAALRVRAYIRGRF